MTGAWELAHAAAGSAEVQLRPLRALDDADRILAVMRETWGVEDLPRELLQAMAASGNVPWGAFVDDGLIGYVLGWAGVDEGELHIHSHMLAVMPGRRAGGVGYALKLAQRAQALDQGIGVARWTFDPLVARNAYFNLHKLGASSDRFRREFYGEMTDDLNRGDRSDRLLVRWELEPEPGPWSVPGEDAALVLLERRGSDAAPTPERASDGVGQVPGGGGVATVQVPEEYAELRSRDPVLADRWREAVASAFEECFAVGLTVVAFRRKTSAYVLSSRPRVRWQGAT